MHGILKVSILLMFLHVVTGHAFATYQKNSECRQILSDSIKGNVTVIYDTVLLPPDTIRLTDTLTIAENSRNKTIKGKSIKDKSLGIKTNVSKKINQNISSRYSLSFSFSPFITFHNFYSATLEDSTKYPAEQPVNTYYEISSGLKFGKWIFFMGMNYTSFSEISNKELTDTIFIQSIHTYKEIRNHFYYAGILFGAGYEIEKRKIILYPRVDIGLSRSIPNKAYKFDSGVNVKEVTSNEYPDFWLAFTLSQAISYKLSKKFMVFIKPSYVYNIYKKNAFPYTYRHNLRLGFGFTFEL